MSKVWDLHIGSNKKFVFLAICDNANDEGVCYPSINYISKKTSISKVTVIKIIRELEEEKYLISHQRGISSGGRKSKLYLVFPSENLEKLDSDYSDKFSQSKEALPRPQSKVALPHMPPQSKVALPKPSIIYNHHLYMLLDDKEKEAYSEYISLRKILKLSTTMGIHNRLLEKYFKFGRNIEVITRAINSNWKDFYEIKDFKPSYKTIEDLPIEERIIEAERIRQEKIEANMEREYGL